MNNQNGWWKDPPSAEFLAANPDYYVVPEVEEALAHQDDCEVKAEALNDQLTDVESIEKTMVAEGGVNQQLVVDMESLAPGVITGTAPLNSFTTDYSRTNLKLSQEAVALTKADLQQKIAQHHAGSLAAHMTFLTHWLGQKDKMAKAYGDTVAKINEKSQALNMNIANVMTKTRSDKASVDAMIEHFNTLIPGDNKIEMADESFVNKLSVLNSFMDAYAADRLGKYFSHFIYRVVGSESAVTDIFTETAGVINTAVPELITDLSGQRGEGEARTAVWATLKQTISGFAKNVKAEQSSVAMASALNVYLQEQMREAVDPSKLKNYVARASYGESPLQSLSDTLGAEISKHLKAIEGLGSDASPEGRIHALRGAADDWTTVYFLAQFLLSASDVIQGFMSVHLELLEQLTEALVQTATKFENQARSDDDAKGGAQAVDTPTEPAAEPAVESLHAALGVRHRQGLFG